MSELSAAADPLAAVASLESVASLETVFAPVRSQTAFEETVERLGTAIKLGLLPPGTRLPAERELCETLGIARSTLRQALVALAQSGYPAVLKAQPGVVAFRESPRSCASSAWSFTAGPWPRWWCRPSLDPLQCRHLRG